MRLRHIATAALTLLFLSAGCTKTPTQTALNTDDWKTYTNTTCGFSFKYPNNFIINPEDEMVVGVRTQEDLDFQNHQDGEVPPFFYLYAQCVPDLKMLVYSQNKYNPDPEAITNLSDFFAADPAFKVLGTTTVDGQQGFELAEGQDSSMYAVWVEHNKIYELNFSEPYREGATGDSDHLNPIQQEILTNFTFTK